MSATSSRLFSARKTKQSELQRRSAVPLRRRVALNRAMQSALATGRLEAKTAARVNQSIRRVELNWLNPEGIPNRPWFKHLLYAARYTYAHLELPGLTEALEAGNWRLAAEQAKILEAAFVKNIALLRRMNDEVSNVK